MRWFWFNHFAALAIIFGIQKVQSVISPSAFRSTFGNYNTAANTFTHVNSQYYKREVSISADGIPDFIRRHHKLLAIAFAAMFCNSPYLSYKAVNKDGRSHQEKKEKKICQINVKKLSPGHALLVNPYDHTKFLYPDRNGYIYFTANSPLHLSCGGHNNKFKSFPNVQHRTFYCVCDETFEFNNVLYDISELNCQEVPKHSIVDKCLIKTIPIKIDYKNYRSYEIGFFTDYNSSFLKVSKIVFNNDKAVTSYTTSTISRFIKGRQSISENLAFDHTHCCGRGNINMNQVYKPAIQLKSFMLQLKNEKDPVIEGQSMNFQDGYLFTPSKLTSADTMIYSAAAAATFSYLNTVPQWYIIRKGNWLKIENHIMKMADFMNQDLTVITGATYALQYIDKSYEVKKPKNMFLYAINPNSQTYKTYFPIPSNLFKIVVNENNFGVVYVTVNDPYAKLEEVKHLCNNPFTESKEVMMPEMWEPKNRNLGISYMCEVQDFLTKIDIAIFEYITAENLLYIPKNYVPQVIKT